MAQDYYGNDTYEGWNGQAGPDGTPMESPSPQVGPAPTGGMDNAQMLALYQANISNGMSPYDAIEAAKASNGGMLGVLNPTYAAHTTTSTELPWMQPEQTQTAAAAPPESNPVGNGGSTGGNSGQGLFNPALYEPFHGQAPTYQAPTLPTAPSFDSYYDQSQFHPAQYHAPVVRQVDPFHAGTFRAPTLEEAKNQPGYEFGVQQGEKALQQSRASQGLLRTGGTLKDILDYGRNAATQNYGNVFNQNLGVFKTNEAGRVGEYNTNYQTQIKDPNDYDQLNAQTEFQGQLATNKQGLDVAQARFAPQLLQYQTNAANAQRQAELGYNADWQKYLDSENVFYNNQNGPFTKYLSLAQLGAANA